MQPPAPKDDERPPDLPRDVPGFRLRRELGRGGMGVVYEAEEAVSGRVVALKVLASELSVSEEAFSRFQREARLAGAISDPNCVFVYGAHQVEGSPAISMELVGGETLEDRLKSGEPIPIETAVQWTIEVLDGLEAAHEVGVVHRDVKPSNCFLSADGHVKVGDFGLARTLERDVQLTQSGAFLGSPLYASPEQVRGRTLDLRSDLYSASATLYAMLTGKAPFSGGSVGEVLARILSEPPPAPRSIRPEIPAGLEKVVLKAMSREPGGRYKSYLEFRNALAPFSGKELRPARAPLRIVAYLIDLIPISVANASITMGTGMRAMDADRPWLVHSPLVMLGLWSVSVLYFSLLEGLFGATPGKWLLGQRVLPVSSGQPSLARAFPRAAVFFAPSYAYYLVLRTLPIEDPSTGSLVQVLGALVIYPAIFCLARPSNGWRGLHELVSGTRTTQRPSPFRRLRPAEGSLRTPTRTEPDMPAVVGDYTVEGIVGETPRGRMLLGRDPELARTVWLHVHDADAPAGSDPLEGGPARLRWLRSLSDDGLRVDVFEDPGGASCGALAELAARPSWALARSRLIALADELAAREEDGTPLAVEQIWIDRAWKVRVLDVPVGTREPRLEAPVAVASGFARLLLRAGPGTGADVPDDLPAHAEGTLRRLLFPERPFASVRELRDELALWEARPSELGTSLRGAQLALAVAFPTIAFLMSLLIAIIVSAMFFEVGTGLALVSQIEDAETALEHDPTAPGPPTGDLLAAHRILISKSFAGTFGPQIARQAKDRRKELLDEAAAAYPAPTSEDIAWAHARFAEAGVPVPRLEKVTKLVSTIIPGVISSATAAWTLFALAFSFLLRGGVSFRLTGIRIRKRGGGLASRLRCLARTAVGLSPVIVMIVTVVISIAEDTPVVALVATVSCLAVAAGGIAFALLSPGGSLQDRIVGTRLVPR